MYTTISSKNNRGTVAIAKSADLTLREDLRPAFFVDVKSDNGDAKVAENPTVFERDREHYMIPRQGALWVGKSTGKQLETDFVCLNQRRLPVRSGSHPRKRRFHRHGRHLRAQWQPHPLLELDI
jgi:hypothetical protein